VRPDSPWVFVHHSPYGFYYYVCDRGGKRAGDEVPFSPLFLSIGVLLLPSLLGLILLDFHL
jgi:hypothetical protein